VEVVGEDHLRRRIDELSAAVSTGTIEIIDEEARVLELAARYASGWRPSALMQALMRATTGPSPPEGSAPE
jgi:hypothetical protein